MPVPHRRGVAAFVIALLVAIGSNGCGDDTTPAPPDDGQYGSVLNAEEFANAPQALPVAALREPPEAIPLPAVVTLTNLPRIAKQGTATALGSPGTCEAQSFGYGLGTYTAARAPDGSVKWNAMDPGNEVSSAFQFALAVNNGFATCPKGGLATPYLSRLASYGSPSTAEVPYEPSCAYFAGIDLAKAYPNESRLRIGSFATFQIENAPASRARIQEYLANQQAVAFSGPVYQGYGSTNGPPLVDGYFYATNLPTSGGHGQLLVGYDDTKGAPGLATGMFLVQNSFGMGWPGSDSKAPERGQIYWAYEALLRTQKLAAVAYPYDPSPPSGTLLTASDPKAPVAAVRRAFQWAPASGGPVWLVVLHHIAQPVRMTAVALKEPAPGTDTATGKYGQYLSNGYTYLRRTDGKAFLPGAYQIKYQAQMLDGTAVSYSGTITVGSSAPVSVATAGMAAAEGKLFDTVGQAALITP